MRKKGFQFLLVLLILSFNSYGQLDKSGKLSIYRFDITEMIAPGIWHKTQKAFQEAKEIKADLIIINMNTYGGMLETADSLRTIILHSKIPVYVFINNNAASAGALISIACNKIYMRKDANIGAASVVNDKGEKLPDKYQSYMRSLMRSTAQARGRNPDIAEAMVGAIKNVENVSDSGRVLTLTAEEAVKANYCEGIAENIYDILKMENITDYEMTRQKITFIDKVIVFFLNPIVSGLLIMLIVAGIYFEFQSPGAILPIVIAGLAAVMYFMPMYFEGLAKNWDIVLFVAGVILVALEIFLIPGNGIPLITGIAMVIVGLTMVMIRNLDFRFNVVPLNAAVYSFFIVITAISISFLASFFISSKLFTTKIFGKRLALDTTQDRDLGYSVEDKNMKSIIGQEGFSLTMLRPVGKVQIHNEIYDAVALTGYINKGCRIKVYDYQNSQLIVEEISN